MFEALQNGFPANEESFANSNWSNHSWNATDHNVSLTSSLPYTELCGHQPAQQTDEHNWSLGADASFQNVYTPLCSPASLQGSSMSQNGGPQSFEQIDQQPQSSPADHGGLVDLTTSTYFPFDENNYLFPLSDYKLPVSSTATSTTSNYYGYGVTHNQGLQSVNTPLKPLRQSPAKNMKGSNTKGITASNVIIAKKQTIKTGIFRIDNKSKILAGNPAGPPMDNTTNSSKYRIFNTLPKFSPVTNKAKAGRPSIRSHTVHTDLQKTSPKTSEWAVVRRHEICIEGQEKVQFPITIIAKKTCGDEPKQKTYVKHANSTTVSSENKPKLGPQKLLKHTCSVCGEPHATRHSLSTHMKSHRLPVCMCCLKVWRSNEQLRAHVRKRNRPGNPRIVLVTSKYGRRRNVLSTADL